MRTRAVDVAVCPPLGLFPNYIAEMATLACLMHYTTISLLLQCLSSAPNPVIVREFIGYLELVVICVFSINSN